MEKSIIVFLALAVFVAHCNVLRDQGSQSHKPEHPRHKRSCHVCDDDGPQRPLPPPPPPPGPPPPPPFFRTQNWSGLTRGANGSPQGVFSGAAAAADLGSQDAGQAFSIASSSAGASVGGGAAGGQSTGFGEQSSANSQAQSGAGLSDPGLGGPTRVAAQSSQHKFGASGSYKESHNSFQSDKHFEGHVGSNGGQEFGENDKHFEGHDGFAVGHGFGGQQQTQGQFESQGGTGSSQGGSASSAQSSSGTGEFNGGFSQEHGPAVGASAPKHVEGAESSGKAQWQSGSGSNEASLSQGLSSGARGAGYGAGYGGSASEGSGQKALSGALGLASQGLQTAQQAGQQGASGCSTCGKSNYALSNAKSLSGNAIAVSVGG